MRAMISYMGYAVSGIQIHFFSGSQQRDFIR